MTIFKIRNLIVKQQISRMVMKVDECCCCVEFFVPKKKVDWMIQWCNENIPPEINWTVGSLFGIGKTMKKGHIEEYHHEMGKVDTVGIKLEIK